MVVEPEALTQEQRLRWFVHILCGMALTGALVSGLQARWGYAGVAVAVALFCEGIAWSVRRWPARFTGLVHGMGAGSTVAIAMLAVANYRQTGSFGESLYFIGLVPVVGGYFLGVGAAVVWGGIVSSVILVLHLLLPPLLPGPVFTPEMALAGRVSELLVIGALTGFAVANRRAWDQYLGRVWSQQRRLEELNQTLEQKVIERTRAWEEQNARLKIALYEAQVAARSRSEFLAQVSHELRTPLNGVIGGVEMLRDGDAAQLDNIQAASGQLLARLETVLEAAEAASGEISLLEQAFSPAQVITRVWAVAREAAQPGVAAGLRGVELLPPTVLGDASQWQRVLQRVLDNAFKFTRRGAVEVELQRRLPTATDKAVTIEVVVRDTGVGFDVGALLASLHANQQFLGDAGTRRQFGGLGFSLPLAIQAAERMGGRVTLVSEIGRGTTVTVSVPFRAAEPVGEAPAQRVGEEPPAGPAARRAILIAEDNDINRRLLIAMVKKLGWEAEGVEDGQQAVERVAAGPERWAGVLMDCQMPVLDGYAATRVLREAGFERPIVAVTANALERDREAALAAGMNDHIPKPVRRETLARVLYSWGPPADESGDAAPTAPDAPPDPRAGGQPRRSEAV